MRKKLTQEEFIGIAKILHKDKYDYSEVIYIDSRTKVKIKCPVHGFFYQLPSTHIKGNGQGCNQCAKEARGIKYRKTKEQFIEQAQKIHENKYDYSKVDYITTDDCVIIICPKHGEFSQTPHSHISQKSGCPICKAENQSIRNIWDKDKFIKKATEKHKNRYDYSKTNYINSSTKVTILCNKIGNNKKPHGEFYVTPNNHISKNSGCPICNESKGENFISNVLQELNIVFNRQKTFSDCKHIGLLKFDFYIPSINSLIEFDGKQHYEPYDYYGGIEEFEKIKLRDRIKNKYCKNKKINLLRLPYWLSENIIKKKIIKLITNA